MFVRWYDKDGQECSSESLGSKSAAVVEELGDHRKFTVEEVIAKCRAVGACVGIEGIELFVIQLAVYSKPDWTRQDLEELDCWRT